MGSNHNVPLDSRSCPASIEPVESLFIVSCHPIGLCDDSMVTNLLKSVCACAEGEGVAEDDVLVGITNELLHLGRFVADVRYADHAVLVKCLLKQICNLNMPAEQN